MNKAEYIAVVKRLRGMVIVHPNYEKVMKELTSSFELHRDTGIAQNLLCTGPSGSGKTTLIHQLKKKYGSIEDDEYQSPIIVVNTPPQPNIKNFAEAFLAALEDPFTKSGNTIQKTNRITEVMKMKQTQMLIVDELQHFVEHGRGITLRGVSDWLKSVIDTAQVSTVLMGLDKAEEVLKANEQIRRRFSQTLRLEPFTIDSKAEAKKFASVIRILDEQIGLPEKIKLGDESIVRFYYATNGLIDYLVKLMVGASELLYSQNRERIDNNVLAGAFQKYIWRDCKDSQNPFHKGFIEQRLDKQNMPFFVG
ncbi:TniB family NTP-binding protein [Pseudoalteromonas sp. OANN1]|uniref:TniB family NTP-binding protein n=1 Tax=Pseudoalteromonas sp. OANN1 TaxID=2954497 RepID=UPI00209708A0|nr:TniB family NTP-binding protein [Pseudoalteromonas sp. OANN1]MCO7200306.1 TniB family NTP-binding protein [Pseudoalteromonas sp. OANN1]